MASVMQDRPAVDKAGLAPLRLQLRPVIELSDEQLLALSSLNPDLRLEWTAQGELMIMPPAGAGTGARNAEITLQLGLWNKSTGRGKVFDSSTGFRLPDGAVRSPDAAWIGNDRLALLSAAQWDRFPSLCPDFVMELRSPSDRLSAIQAKLQEYLDNGARLGWLIDPARRRIYVYRPGQAVEVLEAPEAVAGEGPVAGFVLDLQVVW